MRKGMLLTVCGLILALGLMPAAAQDESSPSPLLRMMARVPNSALGRDFFSYIDYQALVETRDGAAQFSTWDEFNAGTENRDEGAALYIAALNGARGGPQFIQYIRVADDVPGVLGFDFFEVERAVAFGQPPNQVDMIEGSFDEAAVIAAHGARDYTQDELEGLTLLCSAAGCDQGMMLNLRDRNTSNLFGGELGRSQPVLLGDDWIASSPSDGSLQQIADAASEAENSLADQPDYRAAAEAISAIGTLRQAMFLQPDFGSSVMELLLGERLSQEQLEEIMDRLEEDFVPMPFYTLAALADVATEDEQQAVIALVYPNAADAEAAAALFPDRLTNAVSLRFNAQFGEIVESRGVTSMDAQVVEAGNRSVVLITLHSPLPSSERDDEDRLTASSLPYALLVDAYASRDMAWLAPTLE